jgi:hypothetical protein
MEHQQQLEKNATESYNQLEKILMFICAPFLVLSPFGYSSNGFANLRSGNYKLKIKQRYVLLAAGLCAWLVIVLLTSLFSLHTTNPHY